VLALERKKFHESLKSTVLSITNGVATNADSSQKTSKYLALEIAKSIGAPEGEKLPGQSMGNNFEKSVEKFLKNSFSRLNDIRPGLWDVVQVGSREGLEISRYCQYAHLDDIAKLIQTNPAFAAALGNDYSIAPDIIVSRGLESDERINKNEIIVDANTAKAADLRNFPGKFPILHASVSTKWTLRSDRAQNARSEALNLIRNRKGRAPHIVVVTGEPTPSRLSSIALGTGDIDCVYHFALYELVDAAKKLNNDEAISMLDILINGNRLKDISDLPLDLAV
jgi:hypothetical protein